MKSSPKSSLSKSDISTKTTRSLPSTVLTFKLVKDPKSTDNKQLVDFIIFADQDGPENAEPTI